MSQKVMVGSVLGASQETIEIGTGSGAGGVIVADHGVPIGVATTINFTGNVVVTDAGGGQIDVAIAPPAFAISSFAGAGSYAATKEIGDTIVSPSFTASYVNGTPVSAHIADGINADLPLISPFTSAQELHSYTKTVPNQTVSWGLTAITALTTATSSVSSIWETRVYYGAATPGTLNAAFIAALASNQLQQATTGTFAIGTLGNTKKAYLAVDAGLAQPTTFKDGGGFVVPTSLVASNIAVTNGFGVTRNMNLYASDNLLNVAFSWVVT